ncbi:MAG: hypothetical protein KAU14_10105, partial [Thermoplasmata archaeon]|nr:hypothetical protein [Thermoplasmata archaeon]
MEEEKEEIHPHPPIDRIILPKLESEQLKKIGALVIVVIIVLAGFLVLLRGRDGDEEYDSDGDGMPDKWERKYGLDPNNSSDAGEDLDNDGYDFDRDGLINETESFTNLEEYLNGTDPTKNDTDGDRMYDGWEVWYQFDPLNSTDAEKDADGDLLMNVGEFLSGTPPRVGDIDEDFLLDSGEVGFGTDAYSNDTDGDGLSDAVELFDYFAYDSIKVDERLWMWMPVVKRLLQISEEGHYRLKIPLSGIMYSPRVLVVNDDKAGIGDFSADVFASRLINSGLRIEMADSNQMRDMDLLEYDFVVWSSGDDPNPLTDVFHRQELVDFVVGGGRLLIEGGAFSTFWSGDRDFREKVLHVQYGEPVRKKDLVPIVEHPVSSGFTLYENVSMFSYLGSDTDSFQNLSDSAAVFEWNLGPYDQGYALNTYDDNPDAEDGGQIVYMAFDLTGIEDYGQMVRLTDNCINWLDPFPTDAEFNMTKLMEAIEIVVEKDGVEIQSMYNNTIISNATSYLSMGLTDIRSFWLQSYDLKVGTYTVTIDLNETAIIGEVPDYFNFTVFLDHILVERFQLDPLNNDTDGDGLSDGLEVAHGTYPLNIDSDHDGLTDYSELVVHGTGPLNRDSDGDMLADGLELGLISDADPTTKTDPLDPDTDDDGLYDGWFDENGDGIFGSGEKGEDTNQNGKRDSTETDPTKWSTDGDSLPDGWELGMHLDPLSDSGEDGDDGNPDGDINRYDQYLTNIMEFNLGTNPRPFDWDGDGNITGGFENGTDYDEDGLQDGQEAFVVFRTSVLDGARNIENYARASDWIYCDQNITDGLPGNAYVFDSVLQGADTTSAINSENIGVKGIFRLTDGTRIFYDKDLDRIYAWEPFSDFNDRDGNGILEGTCYVFVSSDMSVVSSDLPVPGYHNRELYWEISPFIQDSDYDGLMDGEEALYDQDPDEDGYPNALDPDSDNDGISDFIEQTIYWDTDVDNDGLENMVDLDSDDDGVADSKEQEAFLDTDRDGLINLLDSDSDNDGLLDGEEDKDGDGFTDVEESSPLLIDTDGDGLSDYEEVWPGVDGYITDPADRDTDDDGLGDGVEVAGWDIIVNGATVHVSSNPTLKNSDGDGLRDELEFLFTDPMKEDSDSDGLWDSLEDRNLNGAWDPGETNPTESDTDNDLLPDGTE